MINVGNFDRKFLKETKDKGIILLKNTSLPSDLRNAIKTDVEMYNRFLRGDFNLPNTPHKTFPTISELKASILKKMETHYKLLGKTLIEWVINLSAEAIFDSRKESHILSNISTYEQAEDVLKNYIKYNKKFFDQAKEVYSYNSTCQVQEDYSLKSASYCTFCSITNLPLIVVNPAKTPTVVNHETQQAVEDMLGFNTHELYKELGPITFELLALDQLFKKRNFLYPTDYYMRINFMAKSLPYISKYFEMILDFSKDEFNISTESFIEKLCCKFNQHSPNIHDYLEKEIASDIIDDDLGYLFSYLKAIELREEILINEENGIQLLDKHLINQNFTFTPPKRGIKIYEKYISELDQKARTN